MSEILGRIVVDELGKEVRSGTISTNSFFLPDENDQGNSNSSQLVLENEIVEESRTTDIDSNNLNSEFGVQSSELTSLQPHNELSRLPIDPEFSLSQTQLTRELNPITTQQLAAGVPFDQIIIGGPGNDPQWRGW